MTPQVETPEVKSFYRVRSLTPGKYEQLLVLKEEARQTNAYIYSAPYCAGPGNGPDNLGCLEGFDYEIELIEATRALAETVDLLHSGCTPENVLGAVEMDEVFRIAGMSVSDILGMYRTFRLTGRINTWEQRAALEKRVALTRSTVRWRLQGSTLREIAEKQVPQTLAKWFPNGVSRETIRRILIRYGLHERGFQVTEQTYNRCRDDELCVERALMAHVRRNGGYLPPLSEKNGATSRTRTRDQFVAANPKIQRELNPKESRREWVQDLKEWVADVAPQIRSEAHAREVFIKKMDDWLADPVMSEMFLVKNLQGSWVARWISVFKPDLHKSGPRKRLEYILSHPNPDTIRELGLEEARRNWSTAKRTLARAVLKNNSSWVEQPEDDPFWDDDT